MKDFPSASGLSEKSAEKDNRAYYRDSDSRNIVYENIFFKLPKLTIRNGYICIAFHLSTSISSVNLAFAGLVDGREVALIFVFGKRYFS